MDNNSHTTRKGESIDDCGLERSERNRYFHGKLMSARDMQAEQRYYRGLFTRHARQVTGQGVVSGLDVTLEESDDGFDVALEAGYAVDCCGRPVVVPRDGEFTVEPDDGVDDSVWVFLEYDECVRETVPVPGAEDACEEQCEYNRVLEVFDIRIEPPEPDRSPTKPVPPVEFPTKSDVEDDDTTALDTIAREYDPDGTPVGCPVDSGHAVFLGQYTKRGDEWRVDDGAQPRSRVYTNDMLYAGLATHTADFRNPHQVSLRAEPADGNALLGNEHDDTDDADVTLTSSDDALAIDVDDQRVDLTMGAAIERIVERRIAPLERHVLSKTVRYTHQTFTRGIYRHGRDEERLFTYGNGLGRAVLQEWDQKNTVQSIRELTKRAIVEQVLEPSAAEKILEELVELEGQFTELVLSMRDEGVVTERSAERLEESMHRLKRSLEGDVQDIVSAQDAFCQAAVLLESNTAFFAVSDLEPTAVEVERGKTVDVSATVTNTGGREDVQGVELRIDGENLDVTEVELAPDASERVSFEIPTENASLGTHEYVVASADDSQTGELTITESDDGGVKPAVEFDLESERERENYALFRWAAPEQLVSGETNLDEGDGLKLTLRDEQGGDELETVEVTVDDESRFETVFDLSEREPDEYFLQAYHDGAHAGHITLVIEWGFEGKPVVDFALESDREQKYNALFRAPEPKQEVRGETNLPSGAEVTLTLRDEQGGDELRTVEATVADDDSFAAVFDLSSYEDGEYFLQAYYQNAHAGHIDFNIVSDRRRRT